MVKLYPGGEQELIYVYQLLIAYCTHAHETFASMSQHARNTSETFASMSQATTAKSLDDTESSDPNDSVKSLDYSDSTRLHGVYVIPYDGKEEFYISVQDIKKFFPEGALGNYVSGRFSQDPVIQVDWCANSFRQLERLLDKGYILDPEYLPQHRFHYNGKETHWRHFFEWIGVPSKDIDTIEIYYGDELTEEQMEQDEEEEEIRRDFKQKKKDDEEAEKLRKNMLREYEMEQRYREYGL